MANASVIRKERIELYVGLFVFVGIAIMAVLIWQFGRFGDRFTDRYQITAHFPDATGVVEGAAVRFGGAKVGYVSEAPHLKSDFSGVELQLQIFDQYRIPEDSEFKIATSGLMGDRYINIEPPQEVKGMIPKTGEAEVQGEDADVIKEVATQAEDLSQKLSIVLDEMTVAVEDTKAVLENLNSVSEKIDESVLSEENLKNIQDTLASVKQTTKNLAEASEKFGPVVDEAKKTVEQANKTVQKAAKPFERADKALADLEPAIAQAEPMMTELREAMDKLNTTVDQITEGDGVTAALISDAELRESLTNFIKTLEEHGILGYKKGIKEEMREDEEPQRDFPREDRRQGPFKLFGR